MWCKVKQLGIVLALGLFFWGVTSQILAEEKNLIAYWKFDEGKGEIVKDSSGKGNHGTIYGAEWVEGTRGPALKFDGKSDYVNCGNDASFDLISAITIEVWVNPAPPHKNRFGIIVSKSDGYGNGYWLSVNDNETVRFAINPVFSNGDTFIDSTIKASGWTHVVGKYDGKRLYVYVNGVCKSKITTQTAIISNTKIASIGKISSSNYYQFNGTIKEVRIYNRALSATEVENHYKMRNQAILKKIF